MQIMGSVRRLLRSSDCYGEQGGCSPQLVCVGLKNIDKDKLMFRSLTENATKVTLVTDRYKAVIKTRVRTVTKSRQKWTGIEENTKRKNFTIASLCLENYWMQENQPKA